MTPFEPSDQPRTNQGRFLARAPSAPELALTSDGAVEASWLPVGVQASLRQDAHDRATLHLRLGLDGVDTFETFDRINQLGSGPSSTSRS